MRDSASTVRNAVCILSMVLPGAPHGVIQNAPGSACPMARDAAGAAEILGSGAPFPE